jgi:hypothetical protein
MIGYQSGWMSTEGSGNDYLIGRNRVSDFCDMLDGVAGVLTEKSGDHRQVDITRGHIEDAGFEADMDDIEVAYIEWMVREAWREAIGDCDDLFWGKAADVRHPDGEQIATEFLAERERGFVPVQG